MARRDAKTDVKPFRPARGLRPDEVACLEIKRTAGLLTVPLPEGSSLVGRSPSAEVSLDVDGVSRHHAKLMIAPTGTVTLVDLDSTNGTYLNRARIQRATVHEHDEIQFGPDITARFVYRTESHLAALEDPEPPAEGPEPPTLSARELEVARMAAQGRTNADIGRALGISPRTVNSHLTKIYERLDVHSRAALAVFLAQHQLLDES